MPFYRISKHGHGETEISESDYYSLKDKIPFANNFRFEQRPEPPTLRGVPASDILAEMEQENTENEPPKKRRNKKQA